MCNFCLDNSLVEKLKTTTDREIIKFLEKEKEIFLNLWEISSNKHVDDNDDNIFANEIRKQTIEAYNKVIKDLNNGKLSKNKLNSVYCDKKVVYSQSKFGQFILDLKDSNLTKTAIYLFGIETNFIDKEVDKDIEIYKIAFLKQKEFKQLCKPITSSEPYRVLSINGGGILGYYEASVLHSISNTYNVKDFGKLFNLICGTSTGAILATGLAKGIPLEDIKTLYKDNAKDIFPNPIPDKNIALFFWILKHLFSYSASQSTLRNILEKTFGEDTTLLNLWKERNIALCIPAIDVDTYKEILFKTPHSDSDTNYINNRTEYKLWEACLASSSAPIFFPFANINNSNYVDGGLWANNPILIALVEALKLSKENQPIEIYTLSPPINSNADIEFSKAKNQGILHWKAGINIADLSIFTQTHGFTNLAQEFADALNSQKRKIKIINFPQTIFAKKHLSKLGLDKSSNESFEIMDKNVVGLDTLIKNNKELQALCSFS